MRYRLPTSTAWFPLFAALVFCQQARAEIRWETSLRAAHAKAQSEGKLLLLHFYTDQCVWCDRLEAGALSAPEVATAIEENYVPVKIHGGQNPSVAQTFRVQGYPTDVIVTTDGTALSHTVSPQATDKYVAMLAAHQPAQADGGDAMLAAAPPQSGLPEPDVANTPSPTPAPNLSLAVAPPKDGDNNTDAGGGIAARAVSHRQPASDPPLPNDGRDQLAADPPSSDPAATPDKLALDGYCAVSLLDKNQWVEGDAEFGVIHLGQLYLFADAATMQTFLDQPEPYTPVLNGIDAVRFFEEQRIVEGKRDFGVRDPEHNRMFFFADEAAMLHFEQQYARYTDAAIEVTRQAVADANPQR